MEPRRLERGELTRIIIGTVAAQDKPITARRLTELLNEWGIDVTTKQMSVRLNELANDGRIERVSKGLFEGV
ncbi:MAG TPA: hypothetical protein PL151_09575 [Phycisphaerae bacterium]|nr:hypothetical protein [Phycisphaerae bacterium]HOM53608.1 hypothetical protein [Phycisphaerae bacterium]HON66465.1 hypothetical protein [Phycisphaerae bacterium]HPP28966.1 hypothetical protein [Phycisphaerae bacterium]HPZ96985.1 hypothetical protein [Phycisphaerae bacterium]